MRDLYQHRQEKGAEPDGRTTTPKKEYRARGYWHARHRYLLTKYSSKRVLTDIDHSDEEHFSDASEGQKSQASIPTTRVERVDDKPAHGEVPGTAAHSIRTEDASPDEYEVIPESEKVQNGGKAPSIPQTVIDKVEPDQPSHGDVEGTVANDLRKADAAPDTVRRAPDVTRTDLEGQ